jgi:hypothetical protein
VLWGVVMGVVSHTVEVCLTDASWAQFSSGVGGTVGRTVVAMSSFNGPASLEL